MPVQAVEVFKRDVRVVKKLPSGVVVGKNGTGARRGLIEEFSTQSRYRLLHLAKNCNADFRSMLTVTYPAQFPGDGRDVKKHLKAFKMRLRRRWPAIKGIWFLEFQRRGAPHFHFLLDLDLCEHGEPEKRQRWRGKREGSDFWTVPALHEWVSQVWFEIVGSGDEKHLLAGCAWEVIEQEDGALRYAAAHAAKPHQKKVPEHFQNVGRFWGVLGPVRLVMQARLVADAAAVFENYGADALSRRGRVRKYLWDGASAFSALEEQREAQHQDDGEQESDKGDVL